MLLSKQSHVVHGKFYFLFFFGGDSLIQLDFICCYIHGKQAICNFDIGASSVTLLVFFVFEYKQYFKSLWFMVSSTYPILGLFFDLQ
jgi:hypothetical protein